MFGPSGTSKYHATFSSIKTNVQPGNGTALVASQNEKERKKQRKVGRYMCSVLEGSLKDISINSREIHFPKTLHLKVFQGAHIWMTGSSITGD